MAKGKKLIQFRPVGNIEDALAHAVKRDADGRDASKIIRDAFWAWYEAAYKGKRGYVERKEYGF